jgi:AcrR family transcriptional regulator
MKVHKAESLRERTKLAVQREISEAAMTLFLREGFDAVTVGQIASEVGLSQRSFFRYFATKEDVVLGHLADAGEHLRAALDDRPGDEPPWTALRAAFNALLVGFAESPETLRQTTQMLLETPSLRARHLEKQLYWQELLVPDIARRLSTSSEGGDAVRAQALVASALACLDAAGTAWARSDDDTPVETFLDAAIDTVRLAD